ncbi:MAG: lipoyl synthase [Phycisphaerae bacterium]
MATENENYNKPTRRLPVWLKRPLPHGREYVKIENLLKDLHLHTVCRSANCPNLGECWSAGTATFMILGKTCSRQCKFCAVEKGTPSPIELDEPLRVAQAAQAMNLRHVVITSVTRDDLPDEGAGHFAQTIIELRKILPTSAIEVLTPDFHCRRDCLDTVARAEPRIFNHNLETVESLTPQIRPQADYHRSLAVLKYVRTNFPAIYVKSGLMVGLGETDDQLRQSLRDLADAGCQIVTVGQYLAPSVNHCPTQRYLSPEWFDQLTLWTRENLPFLAFAASPFVRSSYLAHELLNQIIFS